MRYYIFKTKKKKMILFTPLGIKTTQSINYDFWRDLIGSIFTKRCTGKSHSIGMQKTCMCCYDHSGMFKKTRAKGNGNGSVAN